MDSLRQSSVQGQLNCPVHKQRNSRLHPLETKAVYRKELLHSLSNFLLASTDTECCYGFRSADLCGFPSNSLSNCIRKSSFL